MPFFATEDRGGLRRVWREAWRKHLEGLPLEPLEAQLADIVGLHPEYQAALAADPAEQERDWLPEQGGSNPFLHMGLHAAVRDGVATDRPRGIRAVFEAILLRSATPHDAEHQLLECLGETLWEAQRSGVPPDELEYLDRARRRQLGL